MRYGKRLVFLGCIWGLSVVLCGLLPAPAESLPRSVTRWEPVVTKYFDKYSHKFKHRHITRGEVRIALYIIYRESRGYVRARNGRYVGLFQCDIAHFQGRYPWTAVSQAATAAMLYVRLGWKPWAWYRVY